MDDRALVARRLRLGDRGVGGDVDLAAHAQGRAAAASACAWLPAEAPTTPAAQPSSPRAVSFAPAPRTLKEPVRCRFSAFSATMPPARSENVRVERMGVRRAVVATPARAARTSSAVTGEDSTVATSVRLSLARGTPWGMEALGTPETLLPNVATLAEGPRWETRTQRLLWVDIDGRALHEYDPETDERPRDPAPAKVGSAAPTQDPGRVLVALADRLAHRRPRDRRPRAARRVPARGARTCAPTTATSTPPGASGSGRCAEDEAPDRAALYRYDPDGTLTTVLEPVSPLQRPRLGRRRAAHVLRRLADEAGRRARLRRRDRRGRGPPAVRPHRGRRRRARRPRASTSRTASGSRSTAAPRSAATGPAARSTRSSSSRPTT